jgi:hypothetical protein
MIGDRIDRPRPTFTRHGRTDGGYHVIYQGGTWGRVVPVHLRSHIRRGRAQVQPHWQAMATNGTEVGSPRQSRLEAAHLLIDAAVIAGAL